MPTLYYPHHLNPLFEDVQRSKIFADSKWFVDAVPLHDSSTILQRYEEEKHKTDFNLKAFLHIHFRFPEQHTSSYNSANRSITQHIDALWEELLRDGSAAAGSLIPLPHPYIVPGGRFREVFYWDSYFTMLGLEVANRLDIVENMLRNFAHLIHTIGFIPNGNRSYFLSRSQPPFFALMVDLLASHRSRHQMQPYYEALEKEHAFWMKGSDEISAGTAHKHVVCLPDGTILNRYWDEYETSRPEAFAEDEKTAKKSHRSNEVVYRHLRAACESGWDFSSRWLQDTRDHSSIVAADIIPVDLNCLMYSMENILANWHHGGGNTDTAKKFAEMADKRKAAIERFCWNEELRFFSDYNFEKTMPCSQLTLAGMFPLFVNIATKTHAEVCEQQLRKHFLKSGGVVTTIINTGEQWDAPNGWAPLQWISFRALMNYGFNETAEELKSNWMRLNEKVYNKTGRMMEKYNVEDISLEAGGGEYPNQDGFGWTNGVYLKFASLTTK